MYDHQTTSMAGVWLFILLAVLLLGVTIYFAPKIFECLDKWANRDKRSTPNDSDEDQQ